MRISEFILGHGPKPTTKFQQRRPGVEDDGDGGGAGVELE
jgi:hypothetical protein